MISHESVPRFVATRLPPTAPIKSGASAGTTVVTPPAAAIVVAPAPS